MKIGEVYMMRTESTPCDEKNHRPALRGRVVYVHPMLRYAVLEFQGIHGSFRESYFTEYLTKKRRVK